MYDYPRNGSMELIFTPEGDRVYQFFEYHREWRTFWMNREHPKDLDLTYEGDSTAHWDGNDLIVDTIGYNDKTMITQGVGHKKSDAFRLEERFHRVDRDHMVIDMTTTIRKPGETRTGLDFANTITGSRRKISWSSSAAPGNTSLR